MSAIGDYIHLTAKGYRDYGIAKNDKYKGKATKLAQSIRIQKSEIQNRLMNNTKNITDENVKKFEEILNTTKEELEQPEDDNNIRAQLKKILDNKFGETMGEIDWSTLNVSEKQGQKSSVSYARQNMKFPTIEKKVQQLNDILDDLRSTDGISNIEEIDQQITALNQQYAKLQEDIKATDRGQNIASLLKNKEDKSKTKLSQDFEAFRKNLNTLISQYVSMPAINLQKGDLFEDLIALAPLTAQEEAKDAVEREMYKRGFVLGKQREKVEFNKQAFKNITKDFENGTLSTSRKVQGKIDVLLKWQGEDLKISAKNVNLQAYYIHILSGSSFLYMMQDLNGDFVNHFINVYSIKDDGKNSLAAEFARQRIVSMDAMKFILMYKALTGDNYQRKAANVFAINDNSSSGKGSIKVYTMDQLIEKIKSKKLYRKGVTLNGKTTLNDENFKIQKNIKVKADKNTEEYNAQTAKIRIANILSYLHSQKIHASLSTSAFKS